MAQSYIISDNNETTKNSFGLYETPFIRHLDGLKPSHRETYSLIDSLCKNKDGYCFAHNQELAEMLGVGERTVRRYLYKLESLGLITIEIQLLYKRKIWTYESLLKQSLYFENSGLAENFKEKIPLDRNVLPPMDRNVLPPQKQEIPTILETKYDLKKSFPRTELSRGDGQKCPPYSNTVVSNVYKESSSTMQPNSQARLTTTFFKRGQIELQEQEYKEIIEEIGEQEFDRVVNAMNDNATKMGYQYGKKGLVDKILKWSEKDRLTAQEKKQINKEKESRGVMENNGSNVPNSSIDLEEQRQNDFASYIRTVKNNPKNRLIRDLIVENGGCQRAELFRIDGKTLYSSLNYKDPMYKQQMAIWMKEIGNEFKERNV